MQPHLSSLFEFSSKVWGKLVIPFTPLPYSFLHPYFSLGFQSFVGYHFGVRWNKVGTVHLVSAFLPSHQFPLMSMYLMTKGYVPTIQLTSTNYWAYILASHCLSHLVSDSPKRDGGTQCILKIGKRVPWVHNLCHVREIYYSIFLCLPEFCLMRRSNTQSIVQRNNYMHFFGKFYMLLNNIKSNRTKWDRTILLLRRPIA